ncbi:MAG: hypothetical protein AAFP77_03270 [Bacteroidota bacterium]
MSKAPQVTVCKLLIANALTSPLKGIFTEVRGDFLDINCFAVDTGKRPSKSDVTRINKSHISVAVTRSAAPPGKLRKWWGDVRVGGRVAGHYFGYDL